MCSSPSTLGIVISKMVSYLFLLNKKIKPDIIYQKKRDMFFIKLFFTGCTSLNYVRVEMQGKQCGSFLKTKNFYSARLSFDTSLNSLAHKIPHDRKTSI